MPMSGLIWLERPHGAASGRLKLRGTILNVGARMFSSWRQSTLVACSTLKLAMTTQG